MNNKKANPSAKLGFKRPLNHRDKSKQHILDLIKKEQRSIHRRSRSKVISLVSGIAASLLLFFFLTENDPSSLAPATTIEEDVFVTSLLMDALLLDETELDEAIQEALLDDFEDDLALN